jgi:hypothetical protein
MKPLTLALVLTVSLLALSGSGFFAWQAAQARPKAGQPPEVAALEARLLEAVERLQTLEGDLQRLRTRVAAQPAPPAARSSAPAAAEGSPPAAPQKAPAAPVRDLEALRALVYQLIQDEREERQLEAQARAEEKQREIQELYQGPYGQFNWRVNRLAKRLELNDGQKQRYFDLLTAYSNRIEEMRTGLDRKNPEVYTAYRERKKQVQEEFEGLVIQSLTPPQAKSFQELPFSERSADPSAAGVNKAAVVLSADGSAGSALNRELGGNLGEVLSGDARLAAPEVKPPPGPGAGK